MTPDLCNVRDTWSTPPEFRKAIANAFGPPCLDVCADKYNTLAREYYDGVERDGLKLPWVPDDVDAAYTGYVWFNPPGSQVAEWTAKALKEARKGARSLGLVQAGLETAWYANVRDHCVTLFLEPRIHFVPPAGIPETSNARNYCLLVFDPWRVHVPGETIRTWNWHFVLTEEEIKGFAGLRAMRRRAAATGEVLDRMHKAVKE